MYVGDVGVRGLHELAWVPLRNAVDEVLAGDATRVELTLLPGNTVRVEDDGPGFPVAIHPRVGRSRLELIFTTFAAGGCAPSGPAEHRRTLAIDVGLCATSALSSRLEVETCRDGRAWRVVLSRGQVVEALRDLGPTTRRGSVVTCTPDPEIFGAARFVWSRLLQRAREVSAAVPTLTLVLRDARSRTSREVVVRSPRGVADLVATIAPHGRWPAPLHRRVEAEVRVDVALQVHDGPSRFVGLVNAEPLGGVHVTALQRAVRQGVQGRAQVVAAVAVFLPEPTLSRWQRPRLDDGPERVSEHVERTVREALAQAPAARQSARGPGGRMRTTPPGA